MTDAAPGRVRLPWITLAVVVTAAVLSALPGAVGALEYRRELVFGEPWRLVTGQLVHWTPRMALVDLGVVLAAGTWVELRDRRLAAWTYALAATLVGLGVHLGSAEIAVYRGSSGLATALVTVALLDLLLRHGDTPPALRALAAVALALLGLKLGWEAFAGASLAAGPLPAGVRVSLPAHLAGALAALLVVGSRSVRASPPHLARVDDRCG